MTTFKATGSVITLSKNVLTLIFLSRDLFKGHLVAVDVVLPRNDPSDPETIGKDDLFMPSYNASFRVAIYTIWSGVVIIIEL